jgi:hypothetical protein
MAQIELRRKNKFKRIRLLHDKFQSAKWRLNKCLIGHPAHREKIRAMPILRKYFYMLNGYLCELCRVV